MLPTIQMAEVQKKNPQDKAFAELEELFSATASIDAIKIFYAAKNGINNSTQTIKDLDLTQKKYYTNLKRLIDTGLIERADGAYRHTTLGKIGFRLAEVLINAISQKDRLDLVDRLSKAKNITIDETEEIMRAILKDTNIVPGERITDILGPVRMADNWEKVVYDLTECIENAKDSIYFASQYLDIRVIETFFSAAQRGVKLNFLTGQKDQVSQAINLLLKTMFTQPMHLKTLFQILNSPELRARCVDLPYTFFVADQKIVMVEVVKPFTREFSLAFFFRNEMVARRLIESFEILWQKGMKITTIFDRFLDVEKQHQP